MAVRAFARSIQSKSVLCMAHLSMLLQSFGSENGEHDCDVYYKRPQVQLFGQGEHVASKFGWLKCLLWQTLKVEIAVMSPDFRGRIHPFLFHMEPVSCTYIKFQFNGGG